MRFEPGTARNRRVFLALLALFLVPIVRPEILEVPTVYMELQDALDLAMEGDTVLVLPGVYPGHFVILDEGVTLAGWHLFSGDTTDIGTTVLDGEGTGCVLRVDTPGNRLTVVHGLTLRNGLGTYGGYAFSERAGGIQLEEGARATLRWARLEHNRAPRGGSAIHLEGRFARLEMDHVRLFDNRATDDANTGVPVHLSAVGVARVSHLECPPGEPWPQLRISARDSLVLSDIVLDGVEVVYGMTSSLSAPRVVLERITIRNLHDHQFRVLEAYGSTSLVATDISVLDNVHDGPQGINGYPYLYLASPGEIVCDGIRFERNRVPHPILLAELVGTGDSVVRNLNLTGNTLGHPDTLTQYPYWPGRMVQLEVARVEDVLLQDNRQVTPRLQSVSYPGGFPYTGSILNLSLPEERDTVLVRGLVAVGNLLEDLDAPTSTEYQNTGMVLRFTGNANSHFSLEDGEFRENSCSHIPAPPATGSAANPNTIVSLSTGHFRIRDCLFLDNPVGAMSVYGSSIDIRNVQQVNPGRNGLLLNASTITARNVLVQGVHQPPDIPASSSACAFQASAGSLADIGNCSITDCDVRSLFGFSGNNSGLAQIRSCILSGNQAAHLVHEGGNPPVIQYRYCLYDQLLPGTGNYVAEDHGMSSERMRREFVPGSPCIDGGEPATGWNDVAVIDLPETPAYPSAGTLRNDVGHLGGPSTKPLPCFDARPAPPTIWITRMPGRIRLEWEAINQSLDQCPANVLGYRILWAGDLSGPWQVLAETGSTFLEIPLVAQQPRRFFRVVSLAATNE